MNQRLYPPIWLWIPLLLMGLLLISPLLRGQEKPTDVVPLPSGQSGPVTVKPAEAPKPPQAQPIPETAMLRYRIILLELQLLTQTVCNGAGLRFEVCEVDWQRGVVVQQNSEAK